MITASDLPNPAPIPKAPEVVAGNSTERPVPASGARRRLGHLIDGDVLRKLIDLRVADRFERYRLAGGFARR